MNNFDHMAPIVAKNVAITNRGANTPETCINCWSVTHELTQLVRSKWPSVWTLPRKDHFLPLIPELYSGPGGRLLDVGASDSALLKEFLNQQANHLKYFAFDVDKHTKQDFYDWDEINGTFDIIVCSQVLEHLSFSEGIRTCARIYQHLNHNGVALFTVPNIFHPNRFLTDPTHVTPWSYDKLGGALLALGFDICGIVRYGDFRLRPASLGARFIRSFADKLRPYLDLDFAPSICVVVRRP